MLHAIRASLMLTAVAAVVPVLLQSEAQAIHFHHCCRVCRYPVNRCCCPRPTVQVIPQTTYQPVYETQLTQRQVLQYRDVAATEYRTEAFVEMVPRTSYRSVPYQVTRRVGEYVTQTVPQQTVRYVPTTTGTTACVYPNGAISALPYSYSSGAAISSAPYPWAGSMTSAPVVSSPIVSSPTPVISSSIGPVPDPRFANSPTTTIAPRAATPDERFGGFQPVETRSADRGPSLFSPAPSAAQVWRTPRGTITR